MAACSSDTETSAQDAHPKSIRSLSAALRKLGSVCCHLAHIGKHASADRLYCYIVALSLQLETPVDELSSPGADKALSAETWREELAIAVRLATESAKGQAWEEDAETLRKECEMVLAFAGTESGEKRQATARESWWRWSCSCQ